jgi:hypothetical protein
MVPALSRRERGVSDATWQKWTIRAPVLLLKVIFVNIHLTPTKYGLTIGV